MASISCTLLKMLMMPKLISSARVVVAMMREFSATHNRMLLSTLRVKRGTADARRLLIGRLEVNGDEVPDHFFQ
jgi:hypothetical protein